MEKSCKVVIIGETHVGKSALMKRYRDNTFDPNFISTIGVDFGFKTFTFDGKSTRFQIWDTAGQERFRKIIRAYCAGVDVVLIAFDMTDLHSFNKVRDWMAEANAYTDKRVLKFLVGTKCDLSESVVSLDDAQKLANELGMTGFTACSAKTGHNIDTLFMNIARATA